MKQIQLYKYMLKFNIFGLAERIKEAKKNPYSRTQRKRNRR